MITDLFLQAVVKSVKARISILSTELEATLDLATFEQELNELMNQVCSVIVAIKLAELLTSAEFLEKWTGRPSQARNGGVYRTRQPQLS